MTFDDLPGVILLVIGVTAIAKSIWGIASPRTFRGFVSFCFNPLMKVRTAVGSACIGIAILFWVIILVDQPLENWFLTALGVLYAFLGLLHFKPKALERLINMIILDRKPLIIRCISIAGAALGALIMWVAIRGLLS